MGGKKKSQVRFSAKNLSKCQQSEGRKLKGIRKDLRKGGHEGVKSQR